MTGRNWWWQYSHKRVSVSGCYSCEKPQEASYNRSQESSRKTILGFAFAVALLLLFETQNENNRYLFIGSRNSMTPILPQNPRSQSIHVKWRLSPPPRKAIKIIISRTWTELCLEAGSSESDLHQECYWWTIDMEIQDKPMKPFFLFNSHDLKLYITGAQKSSQSHKTSIFEIPFASPSMRSATL